MEGIESIIQLSLSFTIVVLLGFSVKMILKWITYLRNKSHQNVDTELFEYIAIALNLIEKVVADIHENVLLEYEKDGHLSEDDIKLIVDKSIKEITKSLTGAQMEAIKLIHGNLEKWLKTQIIISLEQQKK